MTGNLVYDDNLFFSFENEVVGVRFGQQVLNKITISISLNITHQFYSLSEYL